MTSKMADKEILCKFQNTGYCKYQDKCKFKHVSEKCGGKCNRKTCQKRHQRPCKFSLKCKRQKSCEYSHDSNEVSEVEGLKAEEKKMTDIIKEVVEENKKMKAQVAHLEKELQKNLEEKVKENNSKMKELVEENKSMKTKMVSLEKEYKTSLEKIKEDVEENKTMEAKVTFIEKELERSKEEINTETDASIEKVVMEFLNKTIKEKVVSMEENLKTAIERIGNQIKLMKEENIKRKKEIISLKVKKSNNTQEKGALVDGLKPSTGFC